MLQFGGANIFVGLVEVPFGCFDGFWVVLVYVCGHEERPSMEVARLDGLYPSGLDGVAAHGM